MNTIGTLSLSQLDQLLPMACEWIESEEMKALKTGLPLSADQLGVARKIGVWHPEKVRLVAVTEMPKPQQPDLLAAATKVGLLGPSVAGLTFRYAIYIQNDYLGDQQLVAHELTHTGQYERLGSIRGFLEPYLRECLTIGYEACSFERQAREIAAFLCPK